MNVTPCRLPGVWLIEPVPVEDERGFFARLWSQAEMEQAGLQINIAQASVSFNRLKGTLRGMHYQVAPHSETKLVRCTNGAVYDVVVDIRPDSETFLQWEAFELTGENHRTLFIPPGLAHGFLTLADATELFYQISTPYCATAAQGYRWNDPAFRIDWPFPPIVSSQRDRNLPDFAH